MANYKFTPPVTSEGPAGFGALFWRYRIDRADTLLMTNGVVTRNRTFEVSEVTAAEHAYIGGHIYTITQQERDQLVAAGYGATITPIT
jgi:hypothetical protein